MRWIVAIAVGYLVVLPVAAWLLVWQLSPEQAILNVACDPTRELWRDLNHDFRDAYERETGKRIALKQSHGGSGSQARAVIDGLEADVVSLALWSDIDAIRREGLIAEGWENRPQPYGSLPYYSTIIFVVRRGNPKAIRDWPDIVRPGVAVMTPNPKTSGNGRLSFLAAWGAVLRTGGSDADAEAFIATMYRQTPVLDTAARGSAMTFAQKGIGDVLLTWENEAHLEVREANGALELVYPPRSIRAEPHVAIVDQNVDRKGSRAVVEKYLLYLHTPEAQETIARHYHRPADNAVLERHRNVFKEIELFDITAVAKSWDDAQKRFFGDGGVFDRIYQTK